MLSFYILCSQKFDTLRSIALFSCLGTVASAKNFFTLGCLFFGKNQTHWLPNWNSMSWKFFRSLCKILYFRRKWCYHHFVCFLVSMTKEFFSATSSVLYLLIVSYLAVSFNVEYFLLMVMFVPVASSCWMWYLAVGIR